MIWSYQLTGNIRHFPRICLSADDTGIDEEYVTDLVI